MNPIYCSSIAISSSEEQDTGGVGKHRRAEINVSTANGFVAISINGLLAFMAGATSWEISSACLFKNALSTPS